MARPAKVCPHGTTGGYQCHRRRGEEACAACLRAWRIYYQRRNGSLPHFLNKERIEKARKLRRKKSRRKVDARRSGRFLTGSE